MRVEWPSSLIDSFRRGDGMFFIGSGLSLPAGIPSWEQLLLDIVEEAIEPGEDRDEICRLIEEDSLLDAGEVCKRVLGDQFYIKTAEIIRSHSPEPTEAHKALAAFPPRLVYTTNFDTLLEAILPGADPPCRNVRDAFGHISMGKWGLIKLHGSVSAPASMVLARSDYERVWRGRMPDVPDEERDGYAQSENLLRLLRMQFSLNAVLFLGFGLRDPNLLRIYAEADYLETAGAYAYALMCKEGFSTREFREIVTSNAERGLNVVECDHYDEIPEALNELRERIGDAPDIHSRSTEKATTSRMLDEPQRLAEVLVSGVYSEEIPDDLVESIADNRCVIVAGAGISTGAGLPTSDRLRQMLIEQILLRFDPTLDANFLNFYEVAQLYEVLQTHQNEGKPLREYLAEIMHSLTGKPTWLHRWISNHFPLIITGNWDMLFERALHQESKSYESIFHDPRERITEPVGKSLLVKFNGSVHSPSSLQVTVEDMDSYPQTHVNVRELMTRLMIHNTVFFTALAFGRTPSVHEAWLRSLSMRDPSCNPPCYVVVTEFSPSLEKVYERYNVKLLRMNAGDAFRAIEERLK